MDLKKRGLSTVTWGSISKRNIIYNHSIDSYIPSVWLEYTPGLRGVGGGGREGLGGLEGLKPPFESDGELFPLTFLFSPAPASSGSSDPFVFVLSKKGRKGREKECSLNLTKTRPKLKISGQPYQIHK